MKEECKRCVYYNNYKESIPPVKKNDGLLIICLIVISVLVVILIITNMSFVSETDEYCKSKMGNLDAYGEKKGNNIICCRDVTFLESTNKVCETYKDTDENNYYFNYCGGYENDTLGALNCFDRYMK